MVIRPQLTDLDFRDPGLARWRHGLAAGRRLGATLQGLVRFAGRAVELAVDQARAFVLDRLDARRPQPAPILRMEEGADPRPEARAVAIVVQFSRGGALTAMVRRQLAAYRDLGFAVVLVSNSPAFPEESWQAARRLAALVVHRRNRGLDFGAWKDLVPVAHARWPSMDELLLANDSILGPIRDLAPYLAAMRAGGPGFYGMLESIQGGPHLQSWFVLARGMKAVGDLSAILAATRLSRSKWTIVQRGELRLARAMHEAGNRVAALFGYGRLVDVMLRDPAQRAYLDRALPGLLEGGDIAAMRALLMERPLNPAHHLWRVLSGPAGCPFIKTELVRRNPGGLPEVDGWAALVPPDSPCPVEELRAHLAALGP